MRYEGKLHTVGPRQLSVEPETRAASREAASTWWNDKKAKNEDAAVPAVPETAMETPKLLPRFPV